MKNYGQINRDTPLSSFSFEAQLKIMKEFNKKIRNSNYDDEEKNKVMVEIKENNIE